MEKAKSTLQGLYGMMWEKPALMEKNIDRDKTAFIILNAANGYIREGVSKNEAFEDVIEPVADLLKYFKENNMPAVFITDSRCKNSTESEPVDELKAIGGYDLIGKTSSNAVIEPKFQEWLEGHPEIDTFVVSGLMTDIDVMQFCSTLKAQFDSISKKIRIILPLNTVDTFDAGSHNVTLVNTMAVYFMEQLGVEIVFEINLKNKIPFEYRQA